MATLTAQRRAAVVKRYLRTGHYEESFVAWEGSFLERSSRGATDLRQALLGAVRERAAAGDVSPVSLPDDLRAFARAKVEPMVRGFFVPAEQDLVVDLLARSVVFVTPATVEDVLRQQRWLSTAWDVANMYLDSIGARLLGPRAPRILGLGEETTSYVSLAYFREPEFLSDYLVHEAAHLFHNCKRVTAGLPEKRTSEWLLPIAFPMRETFALACEFYSQITARATTGAERRHLLERLEADRPRGQRADGGQCLDVVSHAIEGRNGWKRILDSCREPVRPRSPRSAEPGGRDAGAGLR